MINIFASISIAICTILVLLGNSNWWQSTKIPLSGTDAYYRLHGIINDGKTINQITLKNEAEPAEVTLRFPPGMYVGVDTGGSHNPKPNQIKSGFATSATISLDAEQLNIIPPAELKASTLLSLQTFRINLSPPKKFSNRTIDTKRRNAARLATLNAEYQKIIPRPAWGLLEYRPAINDRSKSIFFLPMDEDYLTSNDNLLVISCWRQDQSYSLLGKCAMSYVQHNGLMATAIWNNALLPYWKDIDRSVIDLIDVISDKI